MQLLLTRNAEIEDIELSKIGGRQNDPDLSDTGVFQAELLAKRIGRYPIDILIASPQHSSMDTAIEMLSGRYIPHQEIIPELFGEEDGGISGELITKDDESDLESSEKLMERTKIAWEKIRKLAEERNATNIAIIGHLKSNQGLVANILHYENPSRTPQQQNTSLSIYDVPSEGPVQIIMEDDISHLQRHIGGIKKEEMVDL